MSFCSLASFENRGLADELRKLIGDRQTGALNMATFLQAVADADALINPAISNLPPDARQDPLLEQLAVALARYNLYPLGAPERVAKDNDNALAKLRQIQRGEVPLGTPETPSSADAPQVCAPARVFDDPGLGGY